MNSGISLALWRRIALAAAIAELIGGCATSAAPRTDIQRPANFVACTSPRPEICTREYRPVCAQRDTGVRCVTAPCPSAEAVTMATACTACSDPKVIGYEPSACR